MNSLNIKSKNNDKRQKLACLLGGIPYTITIIHSTMPTLQETVYRNDSVLFNLHESCFTNTSYDLKVCFTTNFSKTKSSGQNLSLLWNIDTYVKSVHAKLTRKLHNKIKLLNILGV